MSEPKSKEAEIDQRKKTVGFILNVIEPLCHERDIAKWTGKRGKMAILNEIVESMETYADQHSTSLTTALKERDDEIKRLKELFNIVFNIDGMTTSEFCAEYLIELPTWKGDVSLAASEFIRIDAIKWKIIKDAAKEIWNTPTDLTVQNGKD